MMKFLILENRRLILAMFILSHVFDSFILLICILFSVLYVSSPQPFWHQGPILKEKLSSADEGRGGDGFICNLASVHTQMNIHSPAACAAWFLTGQGLVLVRSPGIGDSCFT